MKKFLLIMLGVAIWTVSWVAVYDVANVWLIRHAPGNPAYKIERLLTTTKMAEVPILGSSRAETCYAPSVLGTNVFNYGISGSCIRETMFHLRMVLERKTSGDIIVNLDPWGFAFYGTEKKSGFAGQYGLAAVRSAVRDELPEGLVSLSDWLPGIRFQGRLKSNLSAWLNTRKVVTKRVDRGAVLITRSRTAREWKIIDATLKAKPFEKPNVEAREEFKVINTLLKKHPHVRIFWVVAPTSPPWKRLYTGENDLACFLSSLKGQHHVVSFLMDDRFDLDDFVDPTHLNEKGAVKFSRLLKDRIENGDKSLP